MTDQTTTEKLAYVLSGVCHPIPMIVTAFVALSISAQHNVWLGLRDVLILGVGLVPSWGYHFFTLRRANTLDYHPLPNYHRVMIPAGFFGMVGVFLAYRWVGATWLQIAALITLTLVTLLCAFINRVWKISIHATLTMFAAVLLFAVSPWLGLAGLLCSLAAGLARLPLRLHTPAQVVAGWVYGLVATVGLLWVVGA